MRKIEKNNEPKEWLEFRTTPGVTTYSPTAELKESLLTEQGHICAYCMRRIPTRDKNSDGKPTSEDARIEHIKCRELHPELQLNYNNMVICCPGSINGDHHCDRRKGNRDITFNLFEKRCIDTISYSTSDGTIKSSNPIYDHEFNQILNLNNKLLKANRLATLSGAIKAIGTINKKRHPNNSQAWTNATCVKMLNKWDQRNESGHFLPYNGIVVWLLKRALQKNR